MTNASQGAVTCTRILEWDAMHRIPHHESKCEAFHGHRYKAEITCSAPELDTLGRIIDFGVIKSVVGAWIDDNWDHTAILSRDDDSPAIQMLIHANEEAGRPVYLMDAPPTAENIVIQLAFICEILLANSVVEVTAIKLWETPNCYATWSRAQ